MQRQVAFVTGASSGIGLASAEAFLRADYCTVLADRDVAGGERAAAQLAELGECIFAACDVVEEASVQKAVDKAVERFGRIDAAFNAAGIDGDRAVLTECSPENWSRIMAVNLTGVWHSMRCEIRQMLKQGGAGYAVVNCASSAGLVGTVQLPAYVASKHGVVGLTRNAALDYARAGIRVNAVCPGMIDTPMWSRAISPELTAQLLETDIQGRLGKPSEIAEAVLWLCSDKASFVTGHAMAVDGGLTAQ